MADSHDEVSGNTSDIDHLATRDKSSPIQPGNNYRRLFAIVQPLSFILCILGLLVSGGNARAQFSADVLGLVASGPFAQPATGVLIITFNPNECGLANAVLQEKATATYSNTNPNGAPLNILFAQSVSVGAQIGNPLHPGVTMNVSAGVLLSGITPPLLYGPYTAEQLGTSDPLVPVVGPEMGLVAQTHASLDALNAGPISTGPATPTPPAPVVLSNSVGVGPDPGAGNNPMSHDIDLIYLDEHSSYTETLADGTVITGDLGDMLFTDDLSDNLNLTTNLPFSTLTSVALPNGFLDSGTAAGSSSILVPVGATITFSSSLGAELAQEWSGCPEPSSYVLAACFLVAGSCCRRNRVSRRSH